MKLIQKHFWLAVAGLISLAIGCATPVGVNQVSYRRAYEQVNANALTSDKLSLTTKDVLHRCNLEKQFADEPRQAVQALHELVCKDRRREILFALAEISVATADRLKTGDFTGRNDVARPYYLASAVYAYMYLFGDFQGAPPSAFDREFRLACDLYNHGLAGGLRSADKRSLALESGTRELPVGKLNATFSFADEAARRTIFKEFLPADDYAVRGLSRRNREAGIGVPLIVVPAALPADSPIARFTSKNIKLPGTVVMRLNGDVCDLSRGELPASLEVYGAFERREIKIGERTVPLESDVTTPLAYGLEGALVWRTAYGQFFSGRQQIESRLYMLSPYQPGKIPVVFVHGTAGAPTDWTDTFNTLYGDPEVRKRCQFWFFSYPSGVPILYSSAILRDSIRDAVTALDPDGKDSALRQIVVVGHSQGGLLTRLMAVSSGNRFWANASDRPFDELKLPESERELLRRCLFFEPSPYVKRVVFVCAPHRGSFRISGFVDRISAKLLQLPQNVMGAGKALVGGSGESLPPQLRKGIPTSVTNMKPGSKFEQALIACPFGPDIKINSIIAVVPGMDIPTGNDTVVEYKSAHLDNAESEFVVRWDHSCVAHPQVVEEMRRILLQRASR